MICAALRSHMTFNRWPPPTTIFLRAEITNRAHLVVIFHHGAASQASLSSGGPTPRSLHVVQQSRISIEPRL